MLKEDLDILQVLVREYGPKVIVSSLAQAMDKEANHLSDLGLKEKALDAINMAEVLREIIGE